VVLLLQNRKRDREREGKALLIIFPISRYNKKEFYRCIIQFSDPHFISDSYHTIMMTCIARSADLTGVVTTCKKMVDDPEASKQKEYAVRQL